MFARFTITPALGRAAAGLVLAIALLAAFPAAAPAADCRAAQVVGLGDRGPEVRAVQQTLARTTYLPWAALAGRFGWRTWHAVVAFQGWHALACDGIVGPRTRAALHHASRPVPWSTREGYEVHVAVQVLLMVGEGRVQRTIHVSTGAGASTPLGAQRGGPRGLELRTAPDANVDRGLGVVRRSGSEGDPRCGRTAPSDSIRAPRQQRRTTMAATRTIRSGEVGARIEVHDISGNVKREGEIVEVLGSAGHEHYHVRWTNGHESIHYPADGTRIFPKASKPKK